MWPLTPSLGCCLTLRSVLPPPPPCADEEEEEEDEEDRAAAAAQEAAQQIIHVSVGSPEGCDVRGHRRHTMHAHEAFLQLGPFDVGPGKPCNFAPKLCPCTQTLWSGPPLQSFLAGRQTLHVVHLCTVQHVL